MSARRPLKISIEGTMGCGKSTFLHYMQCCAPGMYFSVVPEQVEKWRNVGGANMLEYGLHGAGEGMANFQHYVLLTTMLANRDVHPAASVVLTDRSLLSQQRIFWKALALNDIGSHQTRVALQDSLDLMISHKLYSPPDIYVYLHLDPQTCYDRVRRRARFEERDYTPEYFQTIYEAHEVWLNKKPQPNVWVLDVNNKSHDDMQKIAQQLWTRIEANLHGRTLYASEDDTSDDTSEISD